MPDQIRLRLLEAAGRVEGRTGIDPLDLRRSVAVTADARLELLPKSIGIGLAALAVAVALVCLRFLVEPHPGLTATAAFVVVDVLLWLGVAACVMVARSARSRRPQNQLYDDAWARFAVEIWPASRYQPPGGTHGRGSYSRTEFLIAVRDGVPLDAYLRRAPFTRMP